MSRVTLNIRQIEMYRAESADLPTYFSEFQAQFGRGADLLRVAKLDGRIVAAYALTSAVAPRGYFGLNWLAVLPDLRRQGIGRWVAGHAMGVAESKSGSGLVVNHDEPLEFLHKLGFRADINYSWRLEFLPE